MNKKTLFVSTALLLALLVVYGLWSNAQFETRRKNMQTLKRGMSRAEIEHILSAPNNTTGRNGSSCMDLHYTGPTMVVTICHDSATSASFYEGKSEITIFE
jgi:hypothetical protein